MKKKLGLACALIHEPVGADPRRAHQRPRSAGCARGAGAAARLRRRAARPSSCPPTCSTWPSASAPGSASSTRASWWRWASWRRCGARSCPAARWRRCSSRRRNPTTPTTSAPAAALPPALPGRGMSAAASIGAAQAARLLVGLRLRRLLNQTMVSLQVLRRQKVTGEKRAATAGKAKLGWLLAGLVGLSMLFGAANLSVQAVSNIQQHAGLHQGRAACHEGIAGAAAEEAASACASAGRGGKRARRPRAAGRGARGCAPAACRRALRARHG